MGDGDVSLQGIGVFLSMREGVSLLLRLGILSIRYLPVGDPFSLRCSVVRCGVVLILSMRFVCVRSGVGVRGVSPALSIRLRFMSRVRVCLGASGLRGVERASLAIRACALFVLGGLHRPIRPGFGALLAPLLRSADSVRRSSGTRFHLSRWRRGIFVYISTTYGARSKLGHGIGEPGRKKTPSSACQMGPKVTPCLVLGNAHGAWCAAPRQRLCGRVPGFFYSAPPSARRPCIA